MHEIQSTDGVFAVREPMWHGLGNVLDDYPTIAEAKKIAHPWEPQVEPVYRRVSPPWDYDLGAPAEPRFEEITDHKAIVRSDTGRLLDVQSDTYEPVLNQTMYDIAEAIEGEAKGSVMLETGGSLSGGRKVWLLVRLRDSLQVNGDPHGTTVPYFALQNAHDGSGAFRGQATMTRIVCANTSQVADMDARARGTEFVFRHTASVHDRIEDAKQALAGWRESIGVWQEMSDHLNTLRVGMEQREAFIEEFIAMPPPHVASARVRNNVEEARAQMRSILDGPTCEGIGHTAHGLVAASVEYLNWMRRARSEETRFKRVYLSRNQIVTDATELALKVAI